MKPHRPDWWRDYLGAPYRWRGRDPETGIDCWGLVVHALQHAFGVAVDDFGRLYPDDGAAGLRQARRAIADELPGWREVEWEEGAVVLFREKLAVPSHIGLALAKPGWILHASHTLAATTFDAFGHPAWKADFVGAYLPR
jgi:cell wall-associated NlpC family hydrolase